jgi:hypothetical protein
MDRELRGSKPRNCAGIAALSRFEEMRKEPVMDDDPKHPVKEPPPDDEGEKAKVIQADEQSDTEAFDVPNDAKIGSARLGDLSDPRPVEWRDAPPPKDAVRSAEVLDDPGNLNNQ